MVLRVTRHRNTCILSSRKQSASLPTVLRRSPVRRAILCQRAALHSPMCCTTSSMGALSAGMSICLIALWSQRAESSV